MISSVSRFLFAAVLPLFAACHAETGTTETEPVSGQRVIQIGPGETIIDALEAYEVVLTFDDGPNPWQTPKVLDLLTQRGVSATFFLRGDGAATFPEAVQHILNRGHSLGSHGWAHTDLTTLPLDDALADVLKTISQIEGAIEGEPPTPVRLFRYPYLNTTPELSELLKEKGLVEVGSNAIGADWLDIPPEKIVENIMTGLENADHRGIVLLHDPFRDSEKVTLAVLDALAAENYTFVSLTARAGAD